MKEKDTLYARILSGDLTAAEEEQLKASGEWDEIQSIVDAMDSLVLPAYDKEVAFECLTTPNKKSKRTVRLLLSWWLAAASIVLVIGCAYFFFRSQTISIKAAPTRWLTYTFPDDSGVMLNDGSTIEYNKSTWSKERYLVLEGEALFRVEKGSPFKVLTKRGTVEVLGTSFNVNSWGRDLFVECYSGKVIVYNADQKVILTKGQSIRLSDEQQNETQSFFHTSPSWIVGESSFTRARLTLVFEELERQYDVTIVSPNISKYFTGSFTHNSIDSALKQICIPLELKYRISNDKKKIIISEE